MEAVKGRAWLKTSKEISAHLDVREVQAGLRSRNYLTRQQSKRLRNDFIEPDLKINDLIEWMPAN